MPDVAPQRSLVAASCDASSADRGGLNYRPPRPNRCFRGSTPAGEVPFFWRRRPAAARVLPRRPAARPFAPLLARPTQTPCSLTPSTTRSGWLAEAERVVPSGVGAVEYGRRRFGLVTGDPLRRWPGTKRRKGRVNDRFATGNAAARARHRAYWRRPVPSWCLVKKGGW